MNKYFQVLVFLSLSPVLSSAETPAGGSEPSLPVWNEMRGEKLIALQARGDAVRGEISFEPCQGCHRRDASGRTSGSYPRLAGQHGTVLIKQMTDIRAGRRNNPKMDPFIGDHVVTPTEIADIAAYLAAMPIPAEIGQGPGTTRARGKELYDRDCAVCHGERGEGRAVKFYPMVAAQHYRYLLREVAFIRDADRRNANPDMVKVIARYSDADLEAVADYMAQLPAPKK